MTIEKPSQQEEEFFIKMDAEKIRKLRAELDRKREEEAKKKEKESYWMKCPKCGTSLQEVKYQDVLIDKCEKCHGIWLDPGELEILVEGKASFTRGLLGRLFGGK
jgi:ribosomal protein L37AE/L43A